jgi:hypothetical protein
MSKMICFSYIAYVFSSTKLEKREEQVLPRTEGGWGEEERQQGEMVQIMYAPVNK